MTPLKNTVKRQVRRLSGSWSRPAPETAEAATSGPGPEVFRSRVMESLKTVYDPEIPVNIVDLGLIYGVAIDEARNVSVTMTLTAPNCPVAGAMPGAVVNAVKNAAHNAGEVTVDLVWDPPWSKDRMSEEARLQLDLL